MERLTKLRTYREKCKAPMSAQWEYLKFLLRLHQRTGFGKKYRFESIHSVRDYQQQVPIHTWEGMSPYIEKVARGHHDVLFSPFEKIVMYAATSGTTGEPKFIPVTNLSYKHYGKYWDHTWANVCAYRPNVFFGKALYFPGDPEEGYLHGIPYGAITAKAYAQQNYLTRQLYPYPHYVCKVKDYDLRHYTIMRVSLEHDIRIIPIANPSTDLKLFEIVRERAEEMIEDIRLGRLKDADRLPPELVAPLLKQLRPNPKRADELSRIYRKKHDLLPSDYWPDLQTVICFASGPMKLYLKQLKNYLENPTIFDFGLLASEGRFSFPLGPLSEQAGCCLTLETNFFEFIPEEQIDLPHPEAFTMDQLEQGRRYFIIVSNASGLYRYNISDLMEVTGFYENAPLVSFCNKGKHIANITGEKITEYQVTESVRKAGEKLGYRLDDFVVCLHWDNKMPNYSLLKGANGKDAPEFLQRFVNSIEEELVHMNVEYRCKRKSTRLGPLTLKVVQGHDYEDYEESKQQAAHNISQYKHAFLNIDPEFEARFRFCKQVSSTLDEHEL